jgi:ABC-type amino acid transport substrate-binding protein
MRAVAGSPLHVDGLPLVDGGRWEAFPTEIEAITALVDDRADAAVLWPEGAAYALRTPTFALAATISSTEVWAEAATPVIAGTVPAAFEAWVTTLSAALDGPHALALLRLALPERDTLTLAGAVALRRADWLPDAS